MNIAIIGSSSFLGKALLQEFEKINCRLYLFSRQSVSTNNNIHWTCYDFPKDPLNYTELLAFDIIYYCAGAGIQPGHQDSSLQIYELNAFEPIRLATALKVNGFKGKLVTFGSYFEIGNQEENRCYTEKEIATHSNSLPNVYCTAKNLLTRFAHCELHPSNEYPFVFQHFILTNIYGAAENKNRLIPYIIQNSKKGEVLNFTAGIQQRQYTHIQDIAMFLQQNIESKQSGIFNLTDEKIISVRDLIELVLKLVSQELNIQPTVNFGAIDKRDLSMKYLGLDTSLLQNYFNFEPKISLEQGIKEYFELY